MRTFLAIQENGEGRPCGWGLASTREVAREEARKQYASHGFEGHGCYPGEVEGACRIYAYEEGQFFPEELPQDRG